jgi:hypothetical protein
MQEPPPPWSGQRVSRDPEGATSNEIARLVGVYDASGSMLGELSYFLRARFGRAHCALCDITHGRVRERADWKACRQRLAVPFITFHRDDQPSEIRHAGGETPPAVIAETRQGRLVLLLGPAELEGCAGSPARLLEAVDTAAQLRGLRWP